MDPGNSILGFFVLCFLGLSVFYLDRMSKDLRQIKTLLAAFMEHRVASTVAENRLAAAVVEANKTPAAGVSR